MGRWLRPRWIQWRLWRPFDSSSSLAVLHDTYYYRRPAPNSSCKTRFQLLALFYLRSLGVRSCATLTCSSPKNICSTPYLSELQIPKCVYSLNKSTGLIAVGLIIRVSTSKSPHGMDFHHCFRSWWILREKIRPHGAYGDCLPGNEGVLLPLDELAS